jgi:rare lipoprotein A
MLKLVKIITATITASGLSIGIASAEASNKSILKASYYSSGHRTASGERFDQNGLTAASRTLPFGTRLHVTNLATGRSVIVRINDRGPFVRGRDLDLARGAAVALGMIGRGTANLKVARLD